MRFMERHLLVRRGRKKALMSAIVAISLGTGPVSVPNFQIRVKAANIIRKASKIIIKAMGGAGAANSNQGLVTAVGSGNKGSKIKVSRNRIKIRDIIRDRSSLHNNKVHHHNSKVHLHMKRKRATFHTVRTIKQTWARATKMCRNSPGSKTSRRVSATQTMENQTTSNRLLHHITTISRISSITKAFNDNLIKEAIRAVGAAATKVEVTSEGARASGADPKVSEAVGISETEAATSQGEASLEGASEEGEAERQVRLATSASRRDIGPENVRRNPDSNT